jgi:hypothetical protein
MELTLDRDTFTTRATTGMLAIDGTFECFTLEDAVRQDGVKIFGETAIPAGRYRADITRGPRFRRDLPLLINVAGFDGIRIHPGNTADDTLGCILVGRKRGKNVVQESNLAFDPLFKRLKAALARGEAIHIVIRNMGTPVA